MFGIFLGSNILSFFRLFDERPTPEWDRPMKVTAEGGQTTISSPELPLSSLLLFRYFFPLVSFSFPPLSPFYFATRLCPSANRPREKPKSSSDPVLPSTPFPCFLPLKDPHFNHHEVPVKFVSCVIVLLTRCLRTGLNYLFFLPFPLSPAPPDQLFDLASWRLGGLEEKNPPRMFFLIPPPLG